MQTNRRYSVRTNRRYSVRTNRRRSVRTNRRRSGDLGRGEEFLDDLSGLIRPLQVACVPSARDDAKCRVLSYAIGEAMPDGGEAVVLLTGEHEHRHLDLDETLPQRLLRPRPAQSQRRRKTGSVVLEPRIETCRPRVEVLEQRPFEPANEESFECPAIADGVELLRNDFVCPDPLGTFVRTLHASGRTDQYRTFCNTRMPDQEMQKYPAPERVSDVVGWPASVRDEIGCLPKIRTNRRRAAMARQIHGSNFTVGGESLGKPLAERPPCASVLREPVDEGDPCTKMAVTATPRTATPRAGTTRTATLIPGRLGSQLDSRQAFHGR